MKYSHKLSDAVHVLAYIEIYKNDDLSSAAIARSVEGNPSMIRRLMSSLVKAGLLNSHPGAVAPELARPLNQITLLDVYKAIDDDRNFLHVDPKTNPNCIVGGNIQETLNEVYDRIQEQAEASMNKVTLDEIVQEILSRNSK